jgi:hypothetical protein
VTRAIGGLDPHGANVGWCDAATRASGRASRPSGSGTKMAAIPVDADG